MDTKYWLQGLPRRPFQIVQGGKITNFKSRSCTGEQNKEPWSAKFCENDVRMIEFRWILLEHAIREASQSPTFQHPLSSSLASYDSYSLQPYLQDQFMKLWLQTWQFDMETASFPCACCIPRVGEFHDRHIWSVAWSQGRKPKPQPQLHPKKLQLIIASWWTKRIE